MCKDPGVRKVWSPQGNGSVCVWGAEMTDGDRTGDVMCAQKRVDKMSGETRLREAFTRRLAFRLGPSWQLVCAYRVGRPLPVDALM